MTKKFKTTNELIEILISKDVLINNKDEAKKIIEKYSYYSIINSYK